MVDSSKLRQAFPTTTVYKDQALIATFKAASIPAFMRDWILKKKADANGQIADADELRKYISVILPKRDEVTAIQDAARSSGASRKFLAKIEVRFQEGSNEWTFEIPELGITHRQTLIEDYVWEKIKDDVMATSGGWGLIQLGYLPPDEERRQGKFSLLEYKNFCPYRVNLERYREARRQFTIDEWMDVLLGAIDYNANGYADWGEKHTMLTRLLPFIEPRINLLELAPKGTGKSYLFGSVGKYGWLITGGTVSRAKMFYDISKRQPGLVSMTDFVALDEIQSIDFPDPKEMQAALKGYMEQGVAAFGDKRVIGQAGIILLGNIPMEDMNEEVDMMRSLPSIFHESALLDRFHGFIRGRSIPRMNESLKINGWALNTEYFSEIMHLMRQQSECILYRHIVEELVSHPESADTRDTEAILRLCTAYVKLLFPHVRKPNEIEANEFYRYCLAPAIKMRTIIRRQLQIIDKAEYGNKNIAVYSINEKYAK